MVNCHDECIAEQNILWTLFFPYTMKEWAIPEKSKQGGGVDYMPFWKTPGIFLFFFLTSWNSWQNKAQPWIFYKTELNPLEIPRPKTKAPGNSTLSSLGHPWKFHVVKKEPLPNTKLTTWTVFGLLCG